MVIDFIIGLTLANGLPHFVLGLWNGRILSAFGFGNKQNIAYGFLNWTIALALFLWKYGLAGFEENGIMLGATTLVVVYAITGKFFYNMFNRKQP